MALAVPLTLLIASWAGFAMAQLPAARAPALLALAVMLRMVPVTALWLTRFLVLRELGLIDTLWALVAPALMGSSPLFVLLFYWTFRRMPAALFEAARLEGLGPLRIWARIAMPLARPTTVAVALLTFMHTGATSSTRCSTSSPRALHARRSACRCCSRWTRPTGRCSWPARW